jgi:hypothetical protein
MKIYEQTAEALAESWLNGNRTYVRDELEGWCLENQSTGIWLAIRVYELIREEYNADCFDFRDSFLDI